MFISSVGLLRNNLMCSVKVLKCDNMVGVWANNAGVKGGGTLNLS